MFHEVSDLRRRPPRGGVGDGPGCLLSRLELCLAQDLNQHGEDVAIDHRLDLPNVQAHTHTHIRLLGEVFLGGFK